MENKNKIRDVIKQTDNRYLNLYALDIETHDGQTGFYSVASRAPSVEQLKAISHENRGDGVAIFAVYGEKKDRLVLIRQFRFPLGDYVYEFPAGLLEPGEDLETAAAREIFEETGLSFQMRKVSKAYTRPYFTSVGMTDESNGMVYGYCGGTPSSEHQEAQEDITVVLADREECKRILREEKVSLLCAYMLMHFIHCKDPDPLDFTDEIE